MRAELLGPSGVGKSTILEIASQRRSTNPEWIGPSEVDSRMGTPPQKPDPMSVRAAFDDLRLRPLVDLAISAVTDSAMSPSQKVLALSFLQRSCSEWVRLNAASIGTTVVHDELLLHRAFSLLLHGRDLRSDTTKYFELAPLPDAAIIFVAEPEVILRRVQTRPTAVNCYAGLDEPGLRVAISHGLEIAQIAAEVLSRRDMDVITIDCTDDPGTAAQEMHEFISDLNDGRENG
jgi:hypothetical protein